MTVWIKAHMKAATALAGAVVAFVGSLYGVDSQAYLAVVGVLTALGVYGVSNDPGKWL